MRVDANAHGKSDAKALETPDKPAVSQADVANYIGGLASELQDLSQQSGLTLLSHLLSMAALYAKQIASEPQETGRSPYPPH